MRSLLFVALIAAPAAADSKTEPVPERPDVPAPGTKGAGAPGMNDVWASGIVTAPPEHADAQPWPRGMVMRPGAVRDHNVLVPGSNHLPDLGPVLAPTWTAEASRGLARGLGGLVELMSPLGL